jgi:UDP-2-acetamido-3-amino-2,3-dideoxy-glucuronate N-acetyltransferase
VGDNVKIQNNVPVYKGVVLVDDVFCGPSCVFTNVVNPRSAVVRKSEYKTTRVAEGATIARRHDRMRRDAGTGRFCGRGAVVTRDVPDYALVVGTPPGRRGGCAPAA